MLNIAMHIGPNQDAFDELMAIFFSGDTNLAGRAAWAMSHCADTYPWLIQKHAERMIHNLKNPVGDPVKRNTLRALRNISISEQLLGLLADICFDYLSSAREPIAVKNYAMDLLLQMLDTYPELGAEMKTIVENQMPFGSAGFRSKGSKIIRTINKRS